MFGLNRQLLINYLRDLPLSVLEVQCLTTYHFLQYISPIVIQIPSFKSKISQEQGKDITDETTNWDR